MQTLLISGADPTSWSLGWRAGFAFGSLGVSRLAALSQRLMGALGQTAEVGAPARLVLGSSASELPALQRLQRLLRL